MGLAEMGRPVIGFDDGDEARLVRMALGLRAVCEVAAVAGADQDELHRSHRRKAT